MVRNFLVAGLTLLSLSLSVEADDWPRFRGPQGNGVVAQSANLPDNWSPEANLAWKTALPGPGASSPIVVDGKIFVTCYSGYGLSQENPGDIEDLVRHLICVDLNSGKILWKNEIPATQPEDPYTGVGVTAHGYASHTPVCDGERVYAFFGKSGVYAFDLEGKQLWHTDVGKESDPSRWGSSSSPILYQDTVIVTASAESQAIIALDTKTGKEVWRQEASGLDNMWGTPSLIKVDDERTDLVMCVARELWGLDPDTGKMRWYADGTGARHAYSSIVHEGNRVYAFTSQGGGSIALDAGGQGDVSKTNTVWTGRDNSSFGSPVRHEDKLYVIARNIMTVVDAKSGKRLQRLRLQGAKSNGGRFGSLDYASPIVVGKRMFYQNGAGQMFVFELGDEVTQVATNQVTDASEKFWGTPAVSDNKLIIRSSGHLYCVADQNESVAEEDQKFAKAEPAELETPPAGEGGGRGGRRQFDPMAMFRQMDSDGDGKVSFAELEGNRLEERIKPMDKDGDELVSQEEFRTGLAAMSQRSGNRGGGRRGSGDYDEPPAKPDRPQRPEMVGGGK